MSPAGLADRNRPGSIPGPMLSPRLLAQVDRPLLGCLAAITLLGLYNLASAGRPLGVALHWSHAAHLVLGLTVAFAVASVPYRHLEGLAYPVFSAVTALLVLTALVGKVVNGSRRWLDLGPINLQTSDLAKLAVIVILARTLHGERFEGGGLTLRELVRPMNVSRPAILLGAILAISSLGDVVRPAKLERWERTRFRPALTLRSEIEHVALGRRAQPPGQVAGARAVRIPEPGVEGRHAALVLDPARGGWSLVPEAPTLVNAVAVTEPTLLRHGDVVQLGASPRARLRFSNSLQRAKPVLPWIAIIGLAWLAAALARQWRLGRWSFRDLVAPIDVVLLPCVLILGQPDLGTSLVVLLIAFSMVLYVGLRPSSLLVLIASGLAFGALAWRFLLKSYQKERVLTFLNPQNDLAGAGYHQHQSLIAVGSGELFGKGHGHGTQTQLSFLPEQQTDFIFSVWAEEHGFVGSALVVLLFAGLILSAIRVGQRARDRFGALLSVGVASMLFWHSIVNMLMVLRLAPVVGVPLPLWSNGGSFVITTMVGIGLLINVSARRHLF